MWPTKDFQLLFEVKYQAKQPQPIYVIIGIITNVLTNASNDGRVLSPSGVVFRIDKAQNAYKSH